ncbi:MAG: LysM peptidoglycan-binding domain-containing protein [Bacteroidota bacterium]
MSKPASMVRPTLDLRKEDVGDLDRVLREYYRSQIKSIEKRKDRKLARKLLQDHLVLPKSRQRTSKDAGYIKEVLGIETPLLDRLEESRLVRRIYKIGTNPIYEVSHDTLVEPILAERNNREAVLRFIKKAWKYLALLLLLWFLLGMVFENTFELLPDSIRPAKRVDVVADKQIIGFDKINNRTYMALAPLLLEESIAPNDSLFLKVPMGGLGFSRLQERNLQDGNTEADTFSIVLSRPIEIPVLEDASSDIMRTFSNVLVPITYGEPNSASNLYARVSGGIRLMSGNNLSSNSETNEVRQPFTQGQDPEEGPQSYDQILSNRQAIEVQLGDTILRVKSTAQYVPVRFTMRLSDLFENAVDKNNAQTLFGDRQVNLNYTVQVGAAPQPSAPPKVQIPSVEGIEVQYSDGTKRFIPNTSGSAEGTETLHVVAAGETLFSIAKMYNLKDTNGNTSTQTLITINGLQNNTLSVGQILIIPNN